MVSLQPGSTMEVRVLVGHNGMATYEIRAEEVLMLATGTVPIDALAEVVPVALKSAIEFMQKDGAG